METKGYKNKHEHCPVEWSDVPCITGDFELDAVIDHCSNEALQERLHYYCSGGAYNIRNGYQGYGGLKGDD